MKGASMSPQTMREIWARITARRLELHFSLEYLAELAGVSYGAVCAYGGGRRQMSPKAIQKLAKALRCDPDSLTYDAAIRPARTRADRLAINRAYRKANPTVAYKAVKRWRDTHRSEDMRRDRLYKQLKRDGPWKDAWAKILDHYGHRCLACKKTGIKIVPDHVVSLASGGDNYPGNLQPLCIICNGVKVNTAKDFRPDRGAWCSTLMDRNEHERMAGNGLDAERLRAQYNRRKKEELASVKQAFDTTMLVVATGATSSV